jgi:predicted Zn finger-like uncharacterized protein
MIEVQCTSCHTRYRIDEQVLPEGLPTFKCSRCGHVFTFEPRKSRLDRAGERVAPKAAAATESGSQRSAGEASLPQAREPLPSKTDRLSRTEPPRSSDNSVARSSSGTSDASRADWASSLAQSGLIENEPPSTIRERSGPAASEVQPAPRDQPHIAEPIASPQPLSSQSTAKQADRFNSAPFTSEDPDAVAGENLSFDFTDEEPAPDRARFRRRSRRQADASEPSDRDSGQWEVGEDDSTAEETARSRGNESLAGEQPTRRSRRPIRADDIDPEFVDDGGVVAEEEAPVYNRAMTHSARFFLLLILLIGAGFGAVTLLIHNAPASSSAALSYLPLVGDRFVTPATPAKLVALRDVYAVYQHSKEGQKMLVPLKVGGGRNSEPGQNLLVISGAAENVGTVALSRVQLTAVLRDAQRHTLASRAVYCGNSVSLSAGMIGQMTEHEIEVLQRLEPDTNFALEPSASCRFVVVFMNPPGIAHAYDVSVSQAVPGAASETEEPAS